MSDSSSIIPVSDEQAKAFQEAAKLGQEVVKTLGDGGGYLAKVLGTVPEDLVRLLGGNWLSVKRRENLARMLHKSKERLRAEGIEDPEPASINVVLPIIYAAASESREELVDLWARLLAATANPSRARSFRGSFVEAASKMDPLDAAILSGVYPRNGVADGGVRNQISTELKIRRDETDTSVSRLVELKLLGVTNPPDAAITPFGREFMRAVQDTTEVGT
jgi:Abortive infection alpha